MISMRNPNQTNHLQWVKSIQINLKLIHNVMNDLYMKQLFKNHSCFLMAHVIVTGLVL